MLMLLILMESPDGNDDGYNDDDNGLYKGKFIFAIFNFLVSLFRPYSEIGVA